MKIVNNMMELIQYIRTKVLVNENDDNDDLTVTFFADDEVDFVINELYSGPRITYNKTQDKIWVVMQRLPEEAIDEKEAPLEPMMVVKTGRIIELIAANKKVINNFLEGEVY